MSSDTFTTALFLITAVIAAGVLINAIFPVVYQMTGTFSSASHETDQRLRTDFRIVLDSANQNQYARVWIKNTGSEQIPIADIERSDVICGDAGNFNLLSRTSSPTPGYEQWTYTLNNLNNNDFWDSGKHWRLLHGLRQLIQPKAALCISSLHSPMVSGDLTSLP